VQAPDGKNYKYAYDAKGNLISVTFPDGKKRQYLYERADFPNALTGIVDEAGRRATTYAYDSNGKAISTEKAGGVDKFNVTYDNANASSATDALGRKRSYTFFPQFGILKPIGVEGVCSDCEGKTLSYSSSGFLASITDWNGNVTKFLRDDLGRETVRTEASGSAEEGKATTEWHPKFRLPTKITEDGRVTSFTYDAKGNLLSRTVTAGALSRTWKYTYNMAGQMLTENGPRTDASDVTRYSYDAQGNLASVTNPLGQVTRFPQYDGAGRPLRIEDPNGLATTLAYDARGRLASLTQGAMVTAYAYDAVGNLTRVKMPDSSSLSYTYDKAQRLTGLSDNLGNRIAYTLDSMDNLTKERVFNSANTVVQARSMAYDALDRLAKVTGGQSQVTTFSYDGNGNLTGSADPLNHATTQSYDARDRPTQTTDAAGGMTQYTYDDLNHDLLDSVTDANGNVTRYTYDGLGNLTQASSPDTGVTTYTYDTAGNAVSATDARGLTTTYTYDRANRITKATFADGKAVTFLYDQGAYGLGRLTKVASAAGSVAWSYDAFGRVASRQQVAGTLALTLAYTYDAQGRLATVTYPSGRQVAYAYDAAGRVRTVTVDGQVLLGQIDYQPFGPASGWVWGNGTSYARHFDADGRLVDYPIGSDVRTLTYDADGRITSFAETAGRQDFDYDPLDRLTEYVSEPQSQAFAYDLNSNRLSLITETASTNYDYDAASNWLLSRDGAAPRTYQYDAAGNLINDGSRTFTYDARGRLVQATAGALTLKYGINGLGQRVFKSGLGVASGTARFVYDEAGRLIGEYNKSGTVVQETVYFEGAPVAVLKPGVIYNVFADHLATPRLIADQSGKTVWSWKSDPFGNGLPTGTLTYNLRFPGQYYDKETGLHYNYYRDYDPTTGRYVQSDPIGLNGGTNTFAYAENNPAKFVDSLGLQALPAPVPTWTPTVIQGGAGAASATGAVGWGTSVAASPVLVTGAVVVGSAYIGWQIGTGINYLIDAAGNALHSSQQQAAFSAALNQIAAQRREKARASSNACEPEEDECARARRDKKAGKDATRRLGGCKPEMTRTELAQRFFAWWDLVDARNRQRDMCPYETDDGHLLQIIENQRVMEKCAELLRTAIH